jgi:phosphatidylserine decarboxylase
MMVCCPPGGGGIFQLMGNSKMRENRSLMIFLLKILPKGLISRIVGYITRIPLPSFILNSVTSLYCNRYKVNREEIHYPEGGFRSFNQFFTRRLREGVHVIDSAEDSVIAPVDARIEQFGEIVDTSIIQAKGVDFSLSDLLPSDIYHFFVDGSFITFYLSPADYHRIHMPVRGALKGYYCIPGKLFTVQEFMVRGLKGLYSMNERVISYIETARGMVAECMIGAMNVGRISLSYADVQTNGAFRKRREYFFPDENKPHLEKGEELGVFNLGSTIILLFEKDMIRFDRIELGSRIRMGERFASIRL